LRMMWVRPGDSTHAQRGMVSFRTRTRNPQSSKRLAIQFSETDPVEVSPAGRVLPVWARRVRRGSVLIRGTGRSVNADRTFFRHPAVTFPSSRSFWAFGGSPQPLARPSAFLATLPTTFRRGSVLIRATDRTVNADRTIFRSLAAAFPSPCCGRGFPGKKSPAPRWFRLVNPVTLPGLPCWNA
jgi:hypothetical protein